MTARFINGRRAQARLTGEPICPIAGVPSSTRSAVLSGFGFGHPTRSILFGNNWRIGYPILAICQPPGMRRLLVDTTPLRTAPDFRRFTAGGFAALLGTQVAEVALPY